MSLSRLTIHELREMLVKRQVSAVDLTKDVLDRIEKVEDKVRAYISLDPEGALSQAEAADKKLKEGTGGALCGIPLSIKDVLCTKGMQTTCGSRILENFVPPYDATAIVKLKQADAVLLGKVAMDEFAMGSTSENCAFGPPKNPWHTEYICGGSSGGSAASVHPPAGLPLWSRWLETNLWQGVPLRPGGICLLPGPDRPPDQECN